MDFIYYKQWYNAIYFNALELDKKQIEKFENITQTYGKIYSEYTKKLAQETKNLQEFSSQDKSVKKKEINSIYKILKKSSKDENKHLKGILNREQRQKYKLLKHLEINNLKKRAHTKDYYKTNPRMNPFGDLVK